MAITTYAELQTAIGNWLNRSDLAASAPDFIALAEAQMERDIDHWRRSKRATASVDTQYVELPSDFVKPERIHMSGAKEALEVMSLAEMQDRRYADDDTAGEPRFYALTGGEIELFPTPSELSSLEMTYQRTIPALSDSNTTNWVLDNAKDLYLYGALMQSAPFLVDDARIAVWQTLYASGVTAINQQSRDAKHGSNLKLRW